MKLDFQSHPSLPLLSWAAVIASGVATIHHGARLEHGDDWLADGAWAGRFEAGLPNPVVDGFFAFGLCAQDGEIQIDTPNNPLERICILREPGRIVLSPSIPFILALAGVELEPGYPDYMVDHFKVISRISENCASIPLMGGRSLQIIANRRVIISKNLDVKIEYRPFERSFRDFSEYRDFLLHVTETVRDNAASPARRAGRYGLASAISSGYDSVMLNVLAAPFGLKNAVTFSRPGDTDDSGEHLGPYIGVNVHPIDRHAYKKLPNFPEAEFFATGARGEDVVLAGAESIFKGNAVITGIFAEIADRNMKNPAADIMRTNTVGCGLLEYRWRAGFLHTPIGHAGCMGMMSLKAICHSKEMEPWSIGGDYDRPVARRIVESAGIPRGSFARRKIGLISVKFNVADDELRSIMNPESHDSLMRFIASERHHRTPGQRLKRAGKYAVYRAERLINHKLQALGISDKIVTSFDLRHQTIPSHSSYLIPWATRLLKESYAKALK